MPDGRPWRVNTINLIGRRVLEWHFSFWLDIIADRNGAAGRPASEWSDDGMSRYQTNIQLRSTFAVSIILPATMWWRLRQFHTIAFAALLNSKSTSSARFQPLPVTAQHKPTTIHHNTRGGSRLGCPPVRWRAISRNNRQLSGRAGWLAGYGIHWRADRQAIVRQYVFIFVRTLFAFQIDTAYTIESIPGILAEGTIAPRVLFARRPHTPPVRALLIHRSR